ncbi:glutathione S-transferase [Aplysia californica]|uniref:Glutathione S-transferase n=1 Tax=Aplysia californica TaxID=6500 RepID=A0ABM0ZUL1_APLCA|nr:glutathione S-transferase [Aplysia californica]
MPKATLTYFDARGRAEIARLVLAAAKKLDNVTDKRIGFEDWPALKENTPFQGLPILEVDGKVFGQGIAIAAYFAREYGLYGKSNIDQLTIDQIALAREDMLVEEAKVAFEKDEATKAEGQKKLSEEKYPLFLGAFTKIIKANKSGFAVGSKLSLADIVIFEGTQGLFEHQPEFLEEKYPEIMALRKKVSETDGIKQYLAKRKPTDF